MKYLIMNHLELVLFHRSIPHAEMVERLGGRCTSAGFVDLVRMRCHGESEGLGIGSDPTDTLMLRRSVPGTLAAEITMLRAELAQGTPEALAAADRRLAALLC